MKTMTIRMNSLSYKSLERKGISIMQNSGFCDKQTDNNMYKNQPPSDVVSFVL